MKAKHPCKFSSKFIFCLLGVFICGCKKFVQTGAPTTEIVSSSVFNSNAAATSAILAIYIQMYDGAESYNLSQFQGLLSDELTNFSTTIEQVQLYTNALTPLYNAGEWDRAYNYIYEANAVISGLQNNGQITPVIAQQLMGEAKFVRAFWHFYLTNMYGNIPIVTTTEYKINESLSRSPQVEVYAQITQDLRDALSLLSANYVDATDTTTTNERVRPTKGAAEALLARVYLYTGKYDSAELEASNVISNSLYSLCKNLSPLMGVNSVFLANSSEAIWQLSTPLPNANNTLDAQYFILLGAPYTSGSTNSTSISPNLLNSFEAGDLRRTNWIDSFQTSSTSYYFPYKYQNLSNTLTEYTMVLRLAEQYLIRAEAEANLGDMSDAAADLNTIRARAGLGASPTLTTSSSLTQADSAILHERQVELFTEWGHRWFDLVRMDSANIVLGAPGNICQNKGGVWNPDWQLYPIPQTEIANDIHLTQNTGY